MCSCSLALAAVPCSQWHQGHDCLSRKPVQDQSLTLELMLLCICKTISHNFEWNADIPLNTYIFNVRGKIFLLARLQMCRLEHSPFCSPGRQRQRRFQTQGCCICCKEKKDHLRKGLLKIFINLKHCIKHKTVTESLEINYLPIINTHTSLLTLKSISHLNPLWQNQLHLEIFI